MKKIMAVSIIVLFGGTAVAQDEEGGVIPQSVIDAFSCLYPKITDVSWDMNDVNYTANFKLDGKSVSLDFDDYGNVTKVKSEIKLYELPLDVNHLISKEYSGWRIGRASHIDSYGTGYYETEIKKDQQTMVLVFNRHGGLMIKVML